MSRSGSRQLRVCIVTPGFISSSPRVFREADALASAGFDVRVVFTQGPLEALRRFDVETTAGRRWRWDAVKWSAAPGERVAFYWSGIRHRMFNRLPVGVQRLAPVAERAEGRVAPELATLAAAEPADLYIGHYPTGLAAASSAAARHGARLGYDVEDLYVEIRPSAMVSVAERSRIEAIERRYVGACAHITAASQPLADEFATRYGGSSPLAIHNCHAWSDRGTIDGLTRDRAGRKPSLYWYSQTVGLDRGLQDVIVAASRLNGAVQLHIRGTIDGHVRDVLTRLARDRGIESDVHLHGPVPPGDLLSRAAEHDIGLAVETPDSLSRQLSVTNKLFLFLTAGLAIAASDLPGQRSVLATCGAASRSFPAGQPDRLADILRTWITHPPALEAARAQALTAAKDRWNWEQEGGRLVNAVQLAIGGRQVRAS